MERGWVLRAGLAGVLLLLNACAARQPGSAETACANFIKRQLTVGGGHTANPLPSSADNIRAGQENFSHYCLVCHGLDGQNTGVPFAKAMSPPVPPLDSPAVQRYTDGQLKWVIENGIFPSGMPASKGILNDDEMWQIVQYIRHLPPQGSLGEPAVYTGEPKQKESPHSTAPFRAASSR